MRRFRNWLRNTAPYRFAFRQWGFCLHDFSQWVNVGAYRETATARQWVTTRQERSCPWCKKMQINNMSSQRRVDLLNPPKCVTCDQPVQPLAGNPGLWPVSLPRHGGNGLMYTYHYKCVSDAIARDTERQKSANEDERMEGQLIDERDDMEERLTVLAEAVGEYFDVPVGEWSSDNNPDQVALDILHGGYKTTRWIEK